MTAPLAASSLGWHPHPEVWALVATIACAYALAVRRLAPAGALGAVPRRQMTAFALGLGAIWVAGDWPVHDVAERSLYSVHMVQHLLISMAAAPLLLIGTPAWMARRIVGRGARLRAVRLATRALLALVIFNAVLVFTHWPVVVEAGIRHESLHFLTHAAIFFSALIMWMPVLSPLLEVPRLSYPGRMLFLFLQSLVPTVPASFLTFGSRPLYHVYEQLPRLGGISAITDQRAAGLIMKIVGGAILWSVIAVLFFRWETLERTEGVDALQWRDVTHDLNRASVRGS